MKYYLYILESEEQETYYIGSSDNPERRLLYHNGESKGYTQRHRPWRLAYTQGFETKKEAQAAEQKVKSWKSKKMTRLLVEGEIDIDDYLSGRSTSYYSDPKFSGGRRYPIPSISNHPKNANRFGYN